MTGIGLLLQLVGAVLSAVSASAIPSNYQIPGDAIFAVLAGLHAQPDNESQPLDCGSASWRGIQQAAAAEWALNAINNQTEENHRIGLEVIDTCASATIAEKRLRDLLVRAYQPDHPPLMGVISVGSTEETASLLPILTANSIPLIVTSSEAAYDLTPTESLFASAPHLQAQMQTIIATVGHMMGQEPMGTVGPGTRIAVLWSSFRAVTALTTEANKVGLVVTLTRQVTHSANSRSRDVPLYRQIENFVSDNALGASDIVVLILKSDEARVLTRGDGRYDLSRFRLKWILSSLEDDPLDHELEVLQLNEVLNGLVVVGPHGSDLHALQSQLSEEVCKESLALPERYAYGGEAQGAGDAPQGDGDETDAPQGGSVLSPLLVQYCQMLKTKALNLVLSDNTGGRTVIMRDDVSVDASRTASMLRAVSSLTAAYRLGQLRVCDVIENCTQKLRPQLGKHMIESLSQLSNTGDEDGNKLRYTADARLLTTFNVVTVRKGQVVQVGVYREQSGMEWLDDIWHTIDNHGFSMSEPLRAPHRVHLVSTNKNPSHSSGRPTLWAVVICASAAAGLVFCMCVSIYAAVRYCEGTLVPSQPFSLMVVLGTSGALISCVLLVLPSVTPSEVTILCCLQHIVPYVSLCIIYSSLLVRGLQLKLENAFDQKKIPLVSTYLPLVVLISLSVVLAVLGDQTALHLLLPDEVPATHHTESYTNNGIVIRRPTINPNSLVSGHQKPIVSLSSDEGEEVTFHSIHLCKKVGDLPAIIGFSFILLIQAATIFLHVTSGSSSQSKESHSQESRLCIVLMGLSIPLLLMFAAVNLYVPLEYQNELSALCLLLLCLVIIIGYLCPKLRHVTSRVTKQFSHKPLSGLSTVSTVYSSSPPPPHFSPSFVSSSSASSMNHFCDVLGRGDSKFEKYKLHESPPKKSPSHHREKVIPYSIPRVPVTRSTKPDSK